ncbi:MAG: hypothetical protein JW737_06195 [Acidobacteria bacterium]|nr:hypothetical protein [Acidobacteriota bacterium]
MYDISSNMLQYAIEGLEQSDQSYAKQTIDTVTKALQEMNIDIRKDISKFMMHFSMSFQKMNLFGFIVLEGNFNKEKMISWFKKTAEVELTEKTINEYKVYSTNDDFKSINFAFDTAGNLIIAFTPESMSQLFNLGKMDSEPTAYDNRFNQTWNDLDTDAAVWGIAHLSEFAMLQMREAPEAMMFANLFYFDYITFTDNYDGTYQESNVDIYVTNPQKRKSLYQVFYGYYMISTSEYSDDPYTQKISKLTKISENPEKNTVNYHLKYSVKEVLSDMKVYMRTVLVKTVGEFKKRMTGHNEYYDFPEEEMPDDPFMEEGE